MIIRHLHPAIHDAMRNGKVMFSQFKNGRDDASTSIHCTVAPHIVKDAFPELTDYTTRELRDIDMVEDVVIRIGLGNVTTTDPNFDMDGARLLALDVSRVGGVRTAPFLVATRAVFGRGAKRETWEKNTVTFTGDGK